MSTRQPYEPAIDEEKKKLLEKNIELTRQLENIGSPYPYPRDTEIPRSGRHFEMPDEDKAWACGIASGILFFLATVYYCLNNPMFYPNPYYPADRISFACMTGFIPSVLGGSAVGGIAHYILTHLKRH
jgi:hypothetical protein